MPVELVIYLKGFCQMLQTVATIGVAVVLLMLVHLKVVKDDKVSVGTMNFLFCVLAVLVVMICVLPCSSFWRALIERYQ